MDRATESAGGVTPTVSVIIPTRNRRGLLPDAIDSVLSQRGEDHELLVVDDDSTDDTWAYLETLSAPTIRTFRLHPHGERSAACNFGLAQARGPFVMFLHDDDFLWPSALATLTAALREEPDAVAAVGARWDWFCEEGYQRRDAHPHVARTRFLFDDLLFGWSAVSGQSLYRTELVREVGGFRTDLNIGEDRDLWLRLARLGPVALRPEIVMTYRWHAGQWRPENVQAIRERIARHAIRALPRDRRRRALLVRKSTWFFDLAQSSLGAGRLLTGIMAATRAVALVPGLFLSPLVGPLFFWRLIGRLSHWLRGR
jgi:glycosyltransferase involved in cell wall biosynthesis